MPAGRRRWRQELLTQDRRLTEEIARRRQVADDYTAGTVSKAEFVPQRDRVDAQISDLENRIHAVASRFHADPAADGRDPACRMGRADEGWKRQFLAAAVDHVEIAVPGG